MNTKFLLVHNKLFKQFSVVQQTQQCLAFEWNWMWSKSLTIFGQIYLDQKLNLLHLRLFEKTHYSTKYLQALDKTAWKVIWLDGIYERNIKCFTELAGTHRIPQFIDKISTFVRKYAYKCIVNINTVQHLFGYNQNLWIGAAR